MAEESKKDGDVATTDIYNVEAAEILANEAQHLPILEAAPIYEKLLSTFPTAAKYWKQYVEAYMNVNNDEATKQIFSRCTMHLMLVVMGKIRRTSAHRPVLAIPYHTIPVLNQDLAQEAYRISIFRTDPCTGHTVSA